VCVHLVRNDRRKPPLQGQTLCFSLDCLIFQWGARTWCRGGGRDQRLHFFHFLATVESEPGRTGTPSRQPCSNCADTPPGAGIQVRSGVFLFFCLVKLCIFAHIFFFLSIFVALHSRNCNFHASLLRVLYVLYSGAAFHFHVHNCKAKKMNLDYFFTCSIDVDFCCRR
jgi:hypothetical protein